MLRLIDGFDHYTTPYSSTSFGKWAAGGSSVTGSLGRFDRGRWLYIGSAGIVHNVVGSPIDGVVLGFAIKMADGQGFRNNFGSSQPILELFNGTTSIGSVIINPDGQSFTVNGTTITYAIPRGLWWHLQVKLTIAGSGVKVNNGSMTAAASLTDTVTSFKFRAMADSNFDGWLMDDFYFCDTTGSTFNDFLGDVSIRTALPSLAGSENDFTPSTGPLTSVNRANMVNRALTSFTDETEYNISGPDNVDDRDLYVTTFPTEGTLLAIQSNLVVRKDSLDPRTGAHVVRFNAVDYEGPTFNFNTMWSHSALLLTLDPEGNPLTWADLANSEFGLKIET